MASVSNSYIKRYWIPRMVLRAGDETVGAPALPRFGISHSSVGAGLPAAPRMPRRGGSGNFVSSPVSNEVEDARTSHLCESGAGFGKLAGSSKPAPPETKVHSQGSLGRCVMSAQTEKTQAVALAGCLLGNEPEQLAREHRVRREALALSITFQL